MKAVNAYHKLSKYPLGNWIFSKLVCFNAPFFYSISPMIMEYEKNRCVIKIKKRRKVLNHLKTIHAVAMCNLAELAAGLTIDATIPNNWRWIPKGMSVEYIKKATSDLIGIVELAPDQLQLGENKVEVKVTDEQNELVFTAIINMYITEKK